MKMFPETPNSTSYQNPRLMDACSSTRPPRKRSPRSRTCVLPPRRRMGKQPCVVLAGGEAIQEAPSLFRKYGMGTISDIRMRAEMATMSAVGVKACNTRATRTNLRCLPLVSKPAAQGQAGGSGMTKQTTCIQTGELKQFPPTQSALCQP